MTIGQTIDMTVTEVSKGSEPGVWKYQAEHTRQGKYVEHTVARVWFEAELGFAQPGQTIEVTIHNESGKGLLIQGE